MENCAWSTPATTVVVVASMQVDVWKYTTTTLLALPSGCHSAIPTLIKTKPTWHAVNWAMPEPLNMTEWEHWGKFLYVCLLFKKSTGH